MFCMFLDVCYVFLVNVIAFRKCFWMFTHDSASPPARKNRKIGLHQIDWLQCDKCPRCISYALLFATLLLSSSAICVSEHWPFLDMLDM